MKFAKNFGLIGIFLGFYLASFVKNSPAKQSQNKEADENEDEDRFYETLSGDLFVYGVAVDKSEKLFDELPEMFPEGWQFDPSDVPPIVLKKGTKYYTK